MDVLDRKILSVLQKEGRISLTELAARVHVSLSSCQRRMRELERSGVVSGYAAVLDRELVGLPVEVLVFVEMKQEDRDTLLEFEAAVIEVDAVLQAQRLFGNPDYLLRLVVSSLNGYQEIEDDQLARLPGVLRLTSTIVMKQVLPDRGLPL
jgi:DNA-binding Lrp family transcriptional regulator